MAFSFLFPGQGSQYTGMFENHFEEFEEFQKAPNVTRTRLYLETLKEVVPQMGKKIVIDEDASQILPLLQLNSENAGGLVR